MAPPKNVSRLPGSRARGEGGFTLIDLLFVVALIGLLSALALPNVTRARGAAQAASALATIRVINSSQLSFAIGCGLGFYAPDLPALGKRPPMSSEGFISDDMSHAASVTRTGYTFTVMATPLANAPAACNGLPAGETAPAYALIGDPRDPNLVPRFFGTNADGLVYEHTKTLDGLMPESGAPSAGVLVTK